jgi:6-pyruvoyltetrahydropterin/6-carboxytetrahydropterin synthase
MLLRREFTFDAAHNLVSYHGKCERLHGHTYRMMVEISGSPDAEGMIVDFVRVKEIVNGEVISKFDHAYLNEIIPQPSAENIARYVFERLAPLLDGPNRELASVQVWETANSSAVFRREDLEAAI